MKEEHEAVVMKGEMIFEMAEKFKAKSGKVLRRSWESEEKLKEVPVDEMLTESVLAEKEQEVQFKAFIGKAVKEREAQVKVLSGKEVKE